MPGPTTNSIFGSSAKDLARHALIPVTWTECHRQLLRGTIRPQPKPPPLDPASDRNPLCNFERQHANDYCSRNPAV